MNSPKLISAAELLVVATVSLLALALGRSQAGDTDEQIDELVESLRMIEVQGGSFGGPYVGISHNDTTKSICAFGEAAYPRLVEELREGNYNSCVYSVFCLRKLRSTEAKNDVDCLRDELLSGKRFGVGTHDHTLLMQIKLYLELSQSRTGNDRR